jgi:histidine ammonia-lyase
VTKALLLTPGSTRLTELRHIYRQNLGADINDACKSRVDAAAAVVAEAAQNDTPVYGINTGFGKLASTRIPAEQTSQLQRNLILSHCCGVGAPLPRPVVRLIMVLKMLSLGRGASGVRWEIIERLQTMLRLDIMPLIPGQGSVGASGDLAPLAHLTAAMIGEGHVFYRDDKMPAAEALRAAGLEPLELGPKEGLGMINGTQVSTALALAGLFDAWSLAQSALVSGALTTDALMGSTRPFRSEIHALRGLQGQIDAALSLRTLLEDSEIRESHRVDDERVQDPYSIRCQPQVMGACLDQFRQVARTLEIEANAVTDNPIVVIEDGSILSGGNFHAEPVAFGADQCALAITEIGSIAARRIATVVDPAQNFGLPAFISPDPGLNSGFMVAEVTAAALMAENKQGEMNHNLAHIVAIELLIAVQGVEFRAPTKTSPRLTRVMRKIRSMVAPLEGDRYLADDIAAIKQLVMERSIIAALDEDGLLPKLQP